MPAEPPSGASPPAQPAAPAARAGARLAWVDHLRLFVIVLVVHMHACVTYSHVGGWYVMEGDDPPLTAKIPYIVWQGHLQAFFMGLLFFLAGVFSHGALLRRGTAGFLKERSVRLGLPSLLFMLVIHPFVVAVLILGFREGQWSEALPYLAGYYSSTRVLSGSGPLWFAVALWVFCLVYAAWPRSEPFRKRPAPGAAALCAFGLGLALATFLVRITQPIGVNVLNMQLCFFSQYIAAFAAGVAAARGGWLEELASAPRARVSGWLGLILGPAALLLILALGGPIQKVGDVPYPFAGGLHWQALAMAAWEQCAGVCLGLGLLAAFSRRCSRPNAAARWFSDRSFAVYVLHTPVLVALTPALRPLHAGLAGSVVALTAVGLAASFLAADAAKRLPGLRSIL